MLSKTCEYALRAILYISVNGSKQNKIGIKEIAKELELPEHFLGKTLQNLVRHKILSSVKGPNGGFYLDDDAKHITIIEIVNVIDGLGAFEQCALGLKECSSKYPCPIHNDFMPYRDHLRKALEKKTINDLAKGVVNGRSFVSNKDRLLQKQKSKRNAKF